MILACRVLRSSVGQRSCRPQRMAGVFGTYRFRSLLLSLEINLKLKNDIRQNYIVLHRIRSHIGRGRFSRLIVEQRDAVAAAQINDVLDVFSKKSGGS
jgi:hypothetical protein